MRADWLEVIVWSPAVCNAYPAKIMTPTATPAPSSARVSPRIAGSATSPIARAATAKRLPTKKSGPLTPSPICTARNVPPQTMVTRTSTSSGADRRQALP